VLVLTMHGEDHWVRAALRAGARGYVLKDAEAAAIERAIRAVADGQTILSAEVRGAAVGGSAEADYPFPDLSPREREVLDRLARGLSTEAIAARLGVAHKTIQNVVSRVLYKLSARDRAQAVALARDAGLGGAEGGE